MSKWTPGTLLDGRKEILLAGTPEKLSTVTTEISSVTVQAEEDNTGKTIVGASTVVGPTATRRGAYLAPGDSITLSITQLPFIWIDATVSTDGVTWIAEGP